MDGPEGQNNPTNAKVGFSFLKDPRTRRPFDGESWLARRIQKSAALSKTWAMAGKGLKKAQIDTYLTQVTRFKEQLALLIQLTWS
jgi:hypothetical protein